MTDEEYFFYEWLILGKGMTADVLKTLSPDDFTRLKIEYAKFKEDLK